MRIDRSRFLVLVGALAAGACTVNSENTQTGDGGGSQTADSGSSTDGGTDGPAVEGGDASGGDDGGEGGVCDDTVGSAADCSTLADAGNADAGCGTTAAQQCAALNTNLKPKVARAALACALAAADVCPQSFYTCAKQALNAACADSTANADCTDIVGNCSGATAADCHALVDGLNATGRQAVVTCSQSTSSPCTGAAGIYSCVEGIVF
jgi:hypothetical protein